MWSQKSIDVSPKRRGCHLITDEILQHVGNEIGKYRFGLCHFFLQHSSASLTINENYDPDVRVDMEMILNRLVPERLPEYTHTMEGPDDLPAHVKSSLFGCSVMIPISGGKLALGTWQGIWLCEHRDRASARSIIMTIQGDQ